MLKPAPSTGKGGVVQDNRRDLNVISQPRLERARVFGKVVIVDLHEESADGPFAQVGRNRQVGHDEGFSRVDDPTHSPRDCRKASIGSASLEFVGCKGVVVSLVGVRSKPRTWRITSSGRASNVVPAIMTAESSRARVRASGRQDDRGGRR